MIFGGVLEALILPVADGGGGSIRSLPSLTRAHEVLVRLLDQLRQVTGLPQAHQAVGARVAVVLAGLRHGPVTGARSDAGLILVDLRSRHAGLATEEYSTRQR